MMQSGVILALHLREASFFLQTKEEESGEKKMDIADSGLDLYVIVASCQSGGE